MTELMIRPVGANDRALWEPLWAGYHRFYERRIAPAVTEFTWKRLTISAEVKALLALDETGRAAGLAQYLFHPSTSNLGGNCYLQDLFVLPAARGQRVGRRLIAAVAEAARVQGAALLYWQTEEFNGPARRLYERVAKRSPFIRYQLEL